jgi:hypothetical protein
VNPAVPDLAPRPVASAEERARLHALVAQHGDEAVSFQSLESGIRCWFDERTGAAPAGGVAYLDTGRAWVAVGSPLASAERRPELARRFVTAARAQGRRALFFGVESPAWAAASFAILELGEQPEFTPAAWQRSRSRHRGLKEQLRRARAKGVAVRQLEPGELAPGTALRSRLELLAGDWLARHHLEPMGFLVALEPFALPEEHVYLLAERGAEVVAFLSAVPIPAHGGWLVEDLLRSVSAPNGTTEVLLDAFMAQLPSDARVTLGLAPLSSPEAPVWARLVRAVMRPLYDFTGLRAFKERLHPGAWRKIWLLRPAGSVALLAIWDALSAFARGRPIAFAARSLWRHPSGPPWLLALPLVPWTALLAWLVMIDRAQRLGWSRATLAAWVLFDAALAVGLFRAALRPTRRILGLLTLAAGADAALSVWHLLADGFGRLPTAWSLRSLATAAPVLGTAILLRALRRARPPGAVSPMTSVATSPGGRGSAP